MAIQGISDKAAWGEFIKATQSARTRNAAFAPAAQPARTAQAYTSQRPTMVAVPAAIDQGYQAKKSVPQGPVLGARFDSYA